MKVNTIGSHTNAHKAYGTAVVIDVLRAFTTACYILEKKVKRLIVVADANSARLYKQKNPNCVLIGEVNGIKPDDFNYGNSPFQVSLADLNNKTIVFSTSAGTKGILNSINAKEIITGAFVNCSAIVSYLKEKQFNKISLICTDDRYRDNEDYMFAEYLKNHLYDQAVDFEKIVFHIRNHPTAEGFIRHPLTEFSRRDFELAMQINKFNFIIKAEKNNNYIHLKRVDI